MGFKWPSEWKDSDAMSYFISDFASPNIRPSRKLSFWSQLICEVCHYRKSPFMTLDDLKRCLAWRGISPLCLEGVLVDMENKKTVILTEKLTESWSQWGLGLLVFPLTSVWNKLNPRDSVKVYSIISALKGCHKNTMDHIHQQESLLFTPFEWNSVVSQFVHPSNIDHFNNYLAFQRDIVLHGMPVSIIKVRGSNEKSVSPIDQIDIAIGKAFTTKNILASKIEKLRCNCGELLSLAKKAKNKNEALAKLRRKKLYENSLSKWEGALNNTECMLLQLQDSQHHKTIVATLKVGAEALQRNKVSLQEVDDIMDQLDEYKTYEEELNGAMTSYSEDGMCDLSLSEELESLLAQDNEPPAKKMCDNEVIDLTLDEPNEDNILTAEEIAELETIEQELRACPSPPRTVQFDELEHPVERETPPKHILARLSPELRRKPGRKLAGELLQE